MWLPAQLDEGPLYVRDLNSEDGSYRRQGAKIRCQFCNRNRVLGKVSLIIFPDIDATDARQPIPSKLTAEAYLPLPAKARSVTVPSDP